MLFAAAFGALSLPLAACGSHAAEDARTRPPLVRVTTAGDGVLSAHSFTGVVTARVQSDLGFRVPGKVTARLVDAGQAVRRGQPLMRIDTTDYGLALDAVRAKAVQTAADEARYRDLVAAGAVSTSTYEQIKASAETARAQMRVAQNEANYGLLLADADGVVVETLAEPGQVVTAGQVVVRLAHSGPREASVSLPETVRPALGAVAEAEVFGQADAAPARLRRLSDAADPLTRTYDARFVLQGAAAAAPLGATVTVLLPEAGVAPGLRVPLAALHDAGQGPGVWIVDPRTSALSWRRVTLSGVGDEMATVTSGLARGDRFVALGAHMLRQGQIIRIAQTTVAAR
jgi:RND family efflux transporter MFP subunit